MDSLRIDSALAYIGGDSNSGKDAGGFLRQGLNPLIHRHGCAVIIIQHTAKPLRVTEGDNVVQVQFKANDDDTKTTVSTSPRKAKKKAEV